MCFVVSSLKVTEIIDNVISRNYFFLKIGCAYKQLKILWYFAKNNR